MNRGQRQSTVMLQSFGSDVVASWSQLLKEYTRRVRSRTRHVTQSLGSSSSSSAGMENVASADLQVICAFFSFFYRSLFCSHLHCQRPWRFFFFLRHADFVFIGFFVFVLKRRVLGVCEELEAAVARDLRKDDQPTVKNSTKTEEETVALRSKIGVCQHSTTNECMCCRVLHALLTFCMGLSCLCFSLVLMFFDLMIEQNLLCDAKELLAALCSTTNAVTQHLDAQTSDMDLRRDALQMKLRFSFVGCRCSSMHSCPVVARQFIILADCLTVPLQEAVRSAWRAEVCGGIDGRFAQRAHCHVFRCDEVLFFSSTIPVSSLFVCFGLY